MPDQVVLGRRINMGGRLIGIPAYCGRLKLNASEQRRQRQAAYEMLLWRV